ncbi:MAG: ribbon-helix-helix protein, CopG family [Chloroflexota bacterium]
MERTTIMAPEELLNRLRRIAQSRRVSLASLIREALEEKAAQERRRPAIAGIAASGLSNLGERSGDEPIEPPPWR